METSRITNFERYQLSESAIVYRVLDGEKELYEILVRRNNQKLFRVIRSYLTDQAEIEDVMQNTYLKAYEKLSQFKHHSAYATWLIRIGINEALARLREKGKVLHLFESETQFKANTILELPDDSQTNPERKMIRQEAKQLLETTVDTLDSKYRVVYILREVEGMSLKEIASALELTIPNVKVRLHRAKAMLKDRLYAHALSKDLFEFGFGQCDRVTERVMSSIR